MLRSVVFCYIGCVPASIKGFWFCSKPFKPGTGVVVCDSPKKYRVPDVRFESAPGAIPPGQINERSIVEHVENTKLNSHNLCGSLPPNTPVFFFGDHVLALLGSFGAIGRVDQMSPCWLVHNLSSKTPSNATVI